MKLKKTKYTHINNATSTAAAIRSQLTSGQILPQSQKRHKIDEQRLIFLACDDALWEPMGACFLACDDALFGVQRWHTLMSHMP